VKRILRSTYYTSVVVVFLLIAAFGLTQTRTFRTYVRTLAIAQLQTLVDGEIEMGSIEGNLGTGFHVDNVGIRKDGREIFFAERLEVRYDPLGLLVQRASISRITLLRPRIHIWRTTDKEWNVSRILIKKAETDTTPSPWLLDFGQIELLGASVTLVDSFALENRTAEDWERHPGHAFDYSDLDLSPLTLRAALRMQGRNTEIAIHSLDFETTRPQFTLNQLSGEFTLSPLSTEIRKLVIRTPGTSLTVDARLEGASPFSVGKLQELEKAPTSLSVSVDKLEFSTFKRFLPGPVDFLDKDASLEVKARGTFGHLRVDEAQVRTPRTYIRIAGTIDNLHNPRDLTLNLHAEDNIIHPADARELLPGLVLPDFQSVGVMRCNYTFQGQPTNFTATLDGDIAAGHFETIASLDLRAKPMIYDASISTKGLDIGSLLRSKELPSSLNTKATLKGSGLRIQDMTAILRLQADTSSLLELPMQNSVFVVNVADRTVRTSLSVNLGPTRIDLNARTQFRNDDSTLYSLNGKVSALNLADVLRKRTYESDLSFDVKSAGSAYRLNPSHARTEITFLRSTFGKEIFEDKSVIVDYQEEDTLHRTLWVRSEPVDVNVEGAFTAAGLVETFRRTGTLLAEALAHRFTNLDSLRAASTTGSRQAFRSRTEPLPEPIAATVSADVRDFHPLGVFLGEPMQGTSDIRVEVGGSTDDLQLRGDVRIGQFAIRTPSASIGIVEGKTSFSLGRLQRVQTLEKLESRLDFAAQQVFYDTLMISGVRMQHRLSSDSSVYSFAGIVDSTIGVEAEGTSLFVPNLIRLNLSKFHVSIADYAFENSDPIDLVVGKDGVRVNALSLQHEAEALTMTGILDPTGVSDLEFSVKNFLIKNLRDFSRNESFVEKVRDFNGILDASGTFSGNFTVPKFDVSLLAMGVTVGPAVFGQVSGRGSYADGLSDVFLEFKSKPEERNARPELLVSGRMPMKLGPVSPERASQGVDLTIQSTGFRLEFLDPFVPVTSNLTGTLQADLRMRGTLSEPLYEGSLSIQNARFLFTPVGIAYNLNGRLVPKNQTITFSGLTLSDIEEDRVPGLIDGLGSMKIEGGLTLDGFEVRDFDLTTNGQLLVMKESYRLPGLPLYGNVYIATGSNRLRWFGTPDRSFMMGDLLIRNANITFPPSQELISEKTRLFRVDFVDDTTRLADSDLDTDEGRHRRAGNGTSMIPVTSELSRGEPQSKRYEKSFLDNIVYDLRVEASGLTQVRFIFNPLTNEELFADLKGRLVFAKDPSASRLTGELKVGPRSYYKYFKTLQATGKLLFTGDIANPELDITATYEGIYQPDTTRIGMSEQDKQEQKVVVQLAITGTRQEPKVQMGLEVYDLDGNKRDQRPDAQSDAIAFLVSGRFKDEMTESQQSSLTTNLLSSIGTSLLSGPLTEFVRSQIGYVTSIDVVYYGGVNRSFGESADVRITGEVGDAVIRLGGRVFSDLGNANVSVQFPMSSVMGSESWRNLILELERRVEGVESIEQRRPSNGLRLLYRITF